MTADLGSPRGHAGPFTLPLSVHKICPLRALTSLHPDVPASFRYLYSLILHRMPATHSLDLYLLHVGSLPNMPLHLFPVFFLDQQTAPFQGYYELLFLSPIRLLDGRVSA
jgi:hypothetical protein